MSQPMQKVVTRRAYSRIYGDFNQSLEELKLAVNFSPTTHLFATISPPHANHVGLRWAKASSLPFSKRSTNQSHCATSNYFQWLGFLPGFVFRSAQAAMAFFLASSLAEYDEIGNNEERLVTMRTRNLNKTSRTAPTKAKAKFSLVIERHNSSKQ